MFKMKYQITPVYLPVPSKRRSGRKISKVRFFVAHDTGNPNSTARNNVNYYKNSANQESVSAHIFVDDKEILECIPAFTGTPEKAWHVLYDMPYDNKLYGDDANDVAIGVEYCYGSKINAEEAYKRYVWVLAYGAYKFNLNPNKFLVGHMTLDPLNKTDPQNGLSKSGRSYKQLLIDVVKEYNDCTGKEEGVDVMALEAWQKEMGIKAINALNTEGLINKPDYWIQRLGESVPAWLFFEMIKRLNDKIR